MVSIQLAVGIFGITFMSILLVVLPEDDGVDRDTFTFWTMGLM